MDNGNYLHIAWKYMYSFSENGHAIMTAVVQTYDDGDNSSTQITSSTNTFLNTWSGVRFLGDPGTNASMLFFLHPDASYNLKGSVREGRY